MNKKKLALGFHTEGESGKKRRGGLKKKKKKKGKYELDE